MYPTRRAPGSTNRLMRVASSRGSILQRTGTVAAIAVLLTTGAFVVQPSVASAALSATLYVNATATATSGCTASAPCQTIQDAVNQAEDGTYSGEAVGIDVAAGTYDENVFVDDWTLQSLTVQGAGAATTVLNAGQAGPGVWIAGGAVTIEGLTIEGGTAPLGGGVANNGWTTLTDDVITANKGTVGGGISNSDHAYLALAGDSVTQNSSGGGGGIANFGTITLTSDTVSGNTSDTAPGGGIANFGTLAATNVTIAQNSATTHLGGGLYNALKSSARLTDDTLSGNAALLGGGVVNNGFMTLANSLLAGNPGFDCSGISPIIDEGYNVADDFSCDLGSRSVSGSTTVGTLALAANGSTGPETEAITASSSAFGEVPPSACWITTDERGLPRPGANAPNCDAGAFELQATPQVIAFTPAAGYVGVPGTLSATGGGSGNPVVFSVDASSAAGVCSVTGTTVAYTAPGTCVLDANQAGNSLYWPAAQVTRSVVVKSPGYDMVGSDGGVFVLSTGQPSGFFGSLPGLHISVNDIAGMVPTNKYSGYDLVGSDGGVFSFPVGQTSGYFGSLPGMGVHVHDIVGIVPTTDDQGYFLVGSDGGVFAFGNAPFEKSLPGITIHVNNIVAIAPTADDGGYWLVSSTGNVYAFGDAAFKGSLDGTSASPVVGIAPTADSNGYWLVAKNGTVTPFGDAASFGTLPKLGVSVDNIAAIVTTPGGKGYWLMGADGGVFPFGNATLQGTLPGLGIKVAGNIVGAVPTL
jgi:hypothetical protein